jgi:CheY-like chemotaxis protein
MKPAVLSPPSDASASASGGLCRRPGRRQGAELPAAALTAYAGPQDRARALADGFQTFLAKPLDIAELVVAVAELGGRPQPAR